MRRHFVIGLLLSLLISLTPAEARAQKDDARMFATVMERLLSSDRVLRGYPQKYAWPPRHFIKEDSAKEVNAYASAHKSHGATLDKESGKVRPVVMVTEGMLKEIIQGDENSLAVIMGHELAHLAKDHVGDRKGETPFLLLAFSRDQEIEADLEGLRYAISAGYPYKAGVAKAILAMQKRTKVSSFEGLHSTHPTWNDRLMFLDREQSKLWGSMSAFQNGYLFLELEQYLSARQCFKAVVTEFPDCYEAWANLGYAQLMQYCDGLDADDLRSFNIGQIVAGGFYARPKSLESKVRGIDEKLWKDAVDSINKALKLKPELALARANLGVAYLVKPDGKDARVASKHLEEALHQAAKDPELKMNRQALAALLINAGVCDLARGDKKETALKFEQALNILDTMKLTPLAKSLDEAILYNQTILDAGSGDATRKKVACSDLEQYLLGACPESAWWTLAHERYVQLAKECSITPRPRDELAKRKGPAALRLVTSVTVDKSTISLAEPLQDAIDRLGKNGVKQPLFPDSKIMRWRFAEQGVDLLGKDRVVAIFLTNEKSPPVVIQAEGTATKAKSLKIGMAEKEVMELLKHQHADFSPRPIDDPGITYVSYPELGLAIRFARQTVLEIALAQVPRFSLGKEK
jgi:tetratricopeptide (TPR) repeat protein